MLSLASLSAKILRANLPNDVIITSTALKKLYFASQKEVEQIKFLNQCITHEVVPKYLIERIPKTQRNKRPFKRTYEKVIQDEIIEKLNLSTEHERKYQSELTLKTNHNNKNVIVNLVHHFSKTDFLKTTEKLNTQLQSLIIQKEALEYKKEFMKDTVINLSNTSLSKSELETLRLGTSMTWPSKHRIEDIEIEMENFYTRIQKLENVSVENKTRIKTNIIALVEHIRNKSTNINSKVKQHLKNLHKLRKRDDIYVSRFDKGNGVCIDDKSQYVDKMTTILSDRSKFLKYTPHGNVKKNTFIYLEEMFNRKISEMVQNKELTKEIGDRVKNTGSQPARLYGLPKVHKNKNNPPYRPVLSMPNAYCTKLAKYLDKLLKDYLPQNNACKDSFEFKEKLSTLNLPDDYIMVSYDVVSLFTNIPLNDTINYICQVIPENNLPFSKLVLSKLLQMACQGIVFSFNNQLYKQIDGVSMGSNLGPTLAAFAMSMLEDQFTIRPIFYQRYVDDIFSIFKTKEEADTFLNNINNLHNNLKFTIEYENNRKLDFLDITLEKKSTTLETNYKIKSTNTGVYLHKTAHSPTKYKRAAINALIYRAYRLSSTPEAFETAFKKIRNIFVNNGYHYNFIEKIKTIILAKEESQSNEEVQNEDIIYLKLPFIKACEKETKNTIKRINSFCFPQAIVRIAYQTRKTKSFFINKDKVPNDVKASIVYKFECDRCNGLTYIGQTSRHFFTRKHEHITGSPDGSEVSHHVHVAQHKHFKIVAQTKHPLIAEAIYYEKVPPEKRLNNNRPPFKLQLFYQH